MFPVTDLVTKIDEPVPAAALRLCGAGAMVDVSVEQKNPALGWVEVARWQVCGAHWKATKERFRRDYGREAVVRDALIKGAKL